MNGRISTNWFLSRLAVVACLLPHVQGDNSTATKDLWTAVQRNDAMLTRDAISNQADIEWRNGTGFTVLHMASASGFVEAMSILLKAGADKEAAANSSDRPLHLAAGNGCDSAVALLVLAGANLHALGDQGMTPLMKATTSGKNSTADLIRSLLFSYAQRKLNANKAATKALWAAVYGDNPLAAGEAIESGADIEDTDNHHLTPLQRAVWRGEVGVVSVLLKAGANKEAVDFDGDRPLHGAAFFGRDEAVALLAVAGADLAAGGHHNWTAVMRAVHNGQTSAAALLLSLGQWI